MTRLYPLLSAAIILTAAQSAFAQGTYTDEGPIVERMKATVAAYEAGDWQTYRSAFADSVMMVNNNVQVSIDERIEEHKAILEVFSNVHFDFAVYGAAELDGNTWGMLWGNWTGTVRSSGEAVQLMVHVASRLVDGKTVEEYGYWDTAEIASIMNAAMSDE